MHQISTALRTTTVNEKRKRDDSGVQPGRNLKGRPSEKHVASIFFRSEFAVNEK